LAGNGSSELLWLVALAYLKAGDRVLVIEPTFGEYANVARIMGAQVESWVARPENGFSLDPEDIHERLGQRLHRLAFLCNPNNPTGQVLPCNQLARWTDAHPQTLFVIDEAYINFTDEVSSSIYLDRPNLLVLRSMTKDYALAGVRLGYAVARGEIIAALAKVQPPWSVNALAQAAGLAVLRDQGYLRDCIGTLHQHKAALVRNLIALGFSPLPSAVHFFLLPVGDGARFRAKLAPRGILVRDCVSFGLPEFVRITTRKPEDNARLLAALREF
jgi:histidinol-phosphate aminotransferase